MWLLVSDLLRSSAPDHNCCLKLRLAEAKSIMCTSRVEAKKNMNMHANYTMVGLIEGRQMLKKSWRKEFECPKYRRTKQGPYTACWVSGSTQFGRPPQHLAIDSNIVCRNPNAPIVGHKKQMEECTAHEQVRAGITTLLELRRSKRSRKPTLVILCLQASNLWQG